MSLVTRNVRRRSASKKVGPAQRRAGIRPAGGTLRSHWPMRWFLSRFELAEREPMCFEQASG
jgi:hypothetical protein